MIWLLSITLGLLLLAKMAIRLGLAGSTNKPTITSGWPNRSHASSTDADGSRSCSASGNAWTAAVSNCDLPVTLCEAGCRRHWTVRWVQVTADGVVEWLLCEVHSARSADLLADLDFDAFPKAVEP